jgi:hypothetical protein
MSTLDLSEYVRVTNRTGARIKGRYDGVDYIFENNEETDVHHLAAAHIFGFGQDDKTNAFLRLGWLATGNYEEGLERLKDIKFGDVPSPASDIQVARGKKTRAPTKTGSPTPLADVGAESGEGASASSPADAEEAEDEEGAGTF